MSNDIIATDLRGSSIDNIVTLFILELNDGTKLYFHPGVDGLLNNISMRDYEAPYTSRTYVPLPIDLAGVEVTGEGASNRPTLTIANVLSLFRDLLPEFEYDSVIGSRLIARTTLEKYLTSGSASSAPTEFPKVAYIVDRLKAETSSFVTFELASPFELENINLPRRTVVGKYCSWIYKETHDKGSGCTWKSVNFHGHPTTHRRFLTEDDTPIIEAAHVSGAPTFSTSDSYSANDVVVHASEYYQATTAIQGITPEGTGDGPWLKVFTFEVWGSGNSYNVGDFVRVNTAALADTVFKCRAAHTSASNNSPEVSTYYWEHGDVCGKTLKSCTARFNVLYTGTPATTNYQMPSTEIDNTHTLPFGAFPGSAKFR